MIFSWTHLVIACFFLAGLLMAIGPLVGSYLLAPRARGGDLGMPYECGIRPLGDAWIRFGVNYYIYALIFLAFEVDVLYLLPVSVVYHQLTFIAFIKVSFHLKSLDILSSYF